MQCFCDCIGACSPRLLVHRMIHFGNSDFSQVHQSATILGDGVVDGDAVGLLMIKFVGGF